MTDPIRWYSAALKAAQSIPQNFGAADQMAAMLAKYGAKASELNYLKVPDFLKQFDKRVPKQALVDYIDENKVLPQEVVKGSTAIGNIDFDKLSENKDVWDHLASEGVVSGYFEDYTNQQRAQYFRSNPDLAREMSGGTKYSDYATHPDYGYKETLLTLPGDNYQPVDADRINQLATNYLNNPPGFGLPGDITPQSARALAAKRLNALAPPLYQSSHWDEPNVLLHMRTSGAPMSSKDLGLPGDEGGDIPFLEELQSDWGQAGRKQGFRPIAANVDLSDLDLPAGGVGSDDPRFWVGTGAAPPELAEQIRALEAKRYGPINPAPLVTSTNDWASAGVRRFLVEAAAQDAPSIAWTTGAQQSARYQGHAPEGMSGFYDKMIPNIINKYIKPYGGKVELVSDKTWSSDPKQWMVDAAAPHTATLPPALRAHLRDNGIPFFRHGGTVEHYANQPVEGYM